MVVVRVCACVTPPALLTPQLTKPAPPQSRPPSRLTGPLTTKISLLIYLTELDASGNLLDGAVKTGIFYLPQLARLNLASNRFSGRLEADLGCGARARELCFGLVRRQNPANPIKPLWPNRL